VKNGRGKTKGQRKNNHRKEDCLRDHRRISGLHRSGDSTVRKKGKGESVQDVCRKKKASFFLFGGGGGEMPKTKMAAHREGGKTLPEKIVTLWYVKRKERKAKYCSK